MNSCNISGQWVEYDNEIRAACESFGAPVYSGKIYANVFCKLCNGFAHNPKKTCDTDDWYESTTKASQKYLVALLDYQSIVQGASYTKGVFLETKTCEGAKVVHSSKIIVYALIFLLRYEW